MNTVSVTGPGVIVGQVNGMDQWQFPVIVNGQAGVATIYSSPGGNYQDIVDSLIYDLQQGNVEVGGIAENDSGTDRLQRYQERRAEAPDRLAAVYGWFTEGFDTTDLKEAKALLDELA
jgi:hypothetical protein